MKSTIMLKSTRMISTNPRKVKYLDSEVSFDVFPFSKKWMKNAPKMKHVRVKSTR
jgi:hypothetical protein